MSVRFQLTAEPRSGAGKAMSRRLRRAGKVPAIIYGAGQAPSAIVLDQASLLHQMQREAFYTSILKLNQGAESVDVVVKDVHRHPYKPELLHLDFQRIVADEEITLDVPIHFLGEAAAKGVKDQGGMLEHLVTEVEVSCLPRHLPEFLELDVSQLELNDVLHMSDIPLPEGVQLVALSHGHDQPVVAIVPPRREEEEAAVPGAEAAEAAEPAAGTEAAKS